MSCASIDPNKPMDLLSWVAHEHMRLTRFLAWYLQNVNAIPDLYPSEMTALEWFNEYSKAMEPEYRVEDDDDIYITRGK